MAVSLFWLPSFLVALTYLEGLANINRDMAPTNCAIPTHFLTPQVGWAHITCIHPLLSLAASFLLFLSAHEAAFTSSFLLLPRHLLPIVLATVLCPLFFVAVGDHVTGQNGACTSPDSQATPNLLQEPPPRAGSQRSDCSEACCEDRTKQSLTPHEVEQVSFINSSSLSLRFPRAHPSVRLTYPRLDSATRSMNPLKASSKTPLQKISKRSSNGLWIAIPECEPARA